jgi:hypothetical protein
VFILTVLLRRRLNTRLPIGIYMAGEHADAEAEELEICCVCLDSLSSAPVVALMGMEEQRACAHFVHENCAERLSPQRCPMCREEFDKLSGPISGTNLGRIGAARVILGAQRLLGLPEQESDTVSTRAVIELLSATFPVRCSRPVCIVGIRYRSLRSRCVQDTMRTTLRPGRQVMLETAVTDLAAEDDAGEIGTEGLAKVTFQARDRGVFLRCTVLGWCLSQRGGRSSRGAAW